MSPEFEVVLNSKTQKGEIKVNLLPGEDPKKLRDEIMKAYLSYRDLQNAEGYSEGLRALQYIFPPEIARGLLLAVVNKDEGAYVSFEKTAPGKYNVLDKRLRDNYKNPFSP